MTACDRKPPDTRVFVQSVGKQLTAKHGKRDHYDARSVADAVVSAGYPLDFACWAYCLFLTPQDFNILHAASGETCDYATMHAEVLADLAGATGHSLFDLGNWELPGVDVTSVFGIVDFTP
jgi:hypothetical protein